MKCFHSRGQQTCKFIGTVKGVFTKGNSSNASRLACVATVSVGFGSKEIPRSGIFGVLLARKMRREPKRKDGRGGGDVSFPPPHSFLFVFLMHDIDLSQRTTDMEYVRLSALRSRNKFKLKELIILLLPSFVISSSKLALLFHCFPRERPGYFVVIGS